MSQIQVERLAQKLRKAFRLRGTVAVAPELSDEIQPVVVLENDRVEDHWAAGERLWAHRTSTAAGAAGTFAHQALENPDTSGVLAIVSLLRNVASANLNVGVLDVLASTAAVAMSQFDARDSRSIQRAQLPVCRITQGNTNVGAQLLAIQDELAGVTVEGDHFSEGPWVVAPGQFLVAEAQLAATALETAFYWRERPLDRGELSG